MWAFSLLPLPGGAHGASPRQDGLQHGLVGHVAMTAVAVRMVPGKLMGKEGMIGMENLRSYQIPSSDSCSFHQMFHDKIYTSCCESMG